MVIFAAGLTLAAMTLAGCGPANAVEADASPGAQLPNSQWSVAPVVTDVCSRVDEQLVAAIIGVPVAHGVSSPNPAPLQNPPAQSCVFTPAEHVRLTVGLGPIPIAPAISGAEGALNLMMNSMPHMTGNLEGVGDLANYQPLNDGILRLDAVQGDGLRWYGIDIEGIDTTTDHRYFSHTTQDQLTALAKRCLNGL
jgi:hypothetical protein